MMHRKSNVNTFKRAVFVVLSAVILSINIRTFVAAGELLPGGFAGLALLIKEIAAKFFNLRLPFGILLVILNSIPAIISFRYIGKWFSIFSCINIVLCGFISDHIPDVFIHLLHGQDVLLYAIFGGMLNAVAISMCLMVDATTGGTDFIAIFMAENKGRDAWNLIFTGNCVVLAIAGFLFSPEKALYSIIFQFTTIMALGVLYRGYQKKTLLIITEKPDEVYRLIRDKTNHDATSFSGIGRYELKERILMYSVVAANEANALVPEIRKIDPHSFVNVLKTEELNGRFFHRRKD